MADDERPAYAAAAEAALLAQFDAGIDAMRRGLACVVPLGALRWFGWAQVEEMVCGSRDFDLASWKRNTKYGSPYSAEHKTVRLFWKVLEGWSADERQRWVRFAWGRTRLPQGARWPGGQHMRLDHGGTDESQLPQGHTCFFSADLPEYTTEERMRTALGICIEFGCAGILNG